MIVIFLFIDVTLSLVCQDKVTPEMGVVHSASRESSG